MNILERGRRAALRRRQRTAFTVLELLAVLAVGALLLALLVPAVQRSREAARLLTCRSRLRQIGLATHAYLEVHREFPGVNRVKTFGCLYALLPYIEQTEVFLRAETIDDFLLKSASIPAIPTYLCPDDPTDRSSDVASYTINGGLMRAVGRARGFYFEPPIRPATVTDGLSQTAFFSEQSTNSWRPGYLLYEPAIPLRRTVAELRDLAARCGASPGTVPPHSTGGFSASVLSNSNGYNHCLPPNSPVCVFSPHPMDVHPPVGGHSHGVNVLYADGAVRFTSEAIDGEIWWALGTIDSGDTAQKQP